MDGNCKPSLGFVQPAIGAIDLVLSVEMSTRKSKKDKGTGVMRSVVADNLRRCMESYFKDKPHVTNRDLYLAEKAEIGLGTVQRTRDCETGASIDTLEALARVLGIAPYEFLIPSPTMQKLLAVPADPVDGLHRAPSRIHADRLPIRHK